jgi:oxygen-independent coproporphyrinogen-3 oxidase
MLPNVLDAWLVTKYGGAVPRYTSYPTANHFTPAIGSEAFGRWLGNLPVEEPVSLYVHIPFCEKLCWYCGCNTSVVRRVDPVRDYVATLSQEIALVRRAIGRRLNVTHLHLGGGSPNILPPNEFDRVFAALNDAFAIGVDAAIAIEIDPRILTPQWLHAVASAGVSRVSFGIQDFDPKVQQAVNRFQPYMTVKCAVDAVRAAGIASINLDLMYGLPHQTADSICRSIDLAISLEPDRLALFGYAHVPWMMAHQKLIDAAALPGPEERFMQQEVASKRLTAAGFVQIGFDHFALPADSLARAARCGTLRRNFQGYTDDDASVLIGLGASSISMLPEGYVQNDASVRNWRQSIECGRLATTRGIRLSPEDKARRALIEELLCNLSVDLTALPDAERGTIYAALDEMEQDGLVTLTGDALRVTERGRPFLRAVCSVFDAYFRREAAAPRHSLAV